MSKLKTLLLVPASLLVYIVLVSGCNNNTTGKTNTADSATSDFVEIFDGKTLNGWDGDTTYWSVEDGNLVGKITPTTLLKTNSFIIWQGGRPADFELTLEFRISKDGNSGINYRSEQLTDISHALRGYQADIDGANNYTG